MRTVLVQDVGIEASGLCWRLDGRRHRHLFFDVLLVDGPDLDLAVYGVEARMSADQRQVVLDVHVGVRDVLVRFVDLQAKANESCTDITMQDLVADAPLLQPRVAPEVRDLLRGATHVNLEVRIGAEEPPRALILDEFLHVLLLECARSLAEVLAEQLASLIQVVGELQALGLFLVQDLGEVDARALELLESLLLLDELEDLVRWRSLEWHLLPHSVELLACSIRQNVSRLDLLLSIGWQPGALHDNLLLVGLEAPDDLLQVGMRDRSIHDRFLQHVPVVLGALLDAHRPVAFEPLDVNSVLVLSSREQVGLR